MEHSTGYVLFMYDAKFANSGPYTCEVIVDTTFDTLMFTKKLLVIGKNSELYDICLLLYDKQTLKVQCFKNAFKSLFGDFLLSILMQMRGWW